MARTDAIVNVKDFGATGDGSTDDTAAIQSAIDATFGSPSNPHGGLSTGYVLNRPLFFPNGTYNISSPLILTQVAGAHIFGAGKMATKIVNINTSGGSLYSGSVFVAHGLAYSAVEHMTLAAAAPVAASFTGSISGTTLTVSSGTGIQPGQVVTGSSTSAANSSLSWSSTSGGQVAAVTVSPHGVPNGQLFLIRITQAPGGYSGTFMATSTGSTTYTYPLASNPGTNTVPGIYTIPVIDGSLMWPVSAISWATGTASVTAAAPHGVPVSNTFQVTLYSVGGAPGFDGTYTATSTGASTFMYPLTSNPGTASGFVGNYAINSTVIVSGSGSTWTVSNSQTVPSGSLSAASVNRCFDLAWDGAGTVSLHADVFRNVRFEGGDTGVGIGDGGIMGSEILFTACDFVSCATGVVGFNQNALDFTVLGGSFQNCGRGIFTQLVSTCSYVNGVSFSGSTDADIRFDSYGGMVVEGCGSTSPAFLDLIGSVTMHTKGCLYTPSPTGSYAKEAQSSLILDGCIVTNAKLSTGNANATGSKLYERACGLPGTFLTGITNPPTLAAAPDDNS